MLLQSKTSYFAATNVNLITHDRVIGVMRHTEAVKCPVLHHLQMWIDFTFTYTLSQSGFPHNRCTGAEVCVCVIAFI